MTCIIGFTNGKTVWMGGDSMAMDSWHNKSVIAQPKVFINKGFLIGYSTSFRMGQLLQCVFVPPECKTKDIYKYMVTKFVDAWRKCMQDKGWLHTSNQGKENGREGSGVFLVGYKGRLFLLQDDMSVSESTSNIEACGCGEHYALTAMTALIDLPPEQRIRRSLEITAELNGGVCPPFTVKKT